SFLTHVYLCLFHCYAAHRALPPFPTRRSSDLGRRSSDLAHRARPEDGDGVTCAGGQFVEDGARTGLDPATDGGQQREFVLVQGLDGHDTTHMGDAACGEGRLSEETPTERFTRCG